MENISEEEKGLASELKSLCDPFGVEKEDKLYDSGQVLLKMGKLYSEKAENCHEGMLQKLTYIRASALLNGAKFRFEKTKSLEKVAEVARAITNLHKSLLVSAGCSGYEGEAIDESIQELKKKLNHLREMAEPKIQEIPVINEVLQSEEEQRMLEREKIEKVQALNASNTQDYEGLMSFVSERVLGVLGSPPCKFAIAGLGSLARKKITLYSDFEHVILLEDEFENQSQEDQRKIREYFRWFTVIFQVIIIGLGETFIRSVGVKSISDLSSGDKSTNWFRDNYTPCGMAFDGMAPHSCKTPLGRQEPTERKKEIFELIQSPSEMARFLSVEERLKNGYLNHLHDILKRTCSVYGSDDVYESFCTRRDEMLSTECPFICMRKKLIRIADNCNKVISKIAFAENSQMRDDVKASLYRPITVLLSNFCRSHEIQEPSTFKIVSSLEKNRVWEKEKSHTLRYAVAVACEARMKVYMEAKQQRNNATMEHWTRMVGKHSIDSCKFNIQMLKLECQMPAFQLSETQKHAIWIENLFTEGLLQEAAKKGEKVMERILQKSRLEDLPFEDMLSYYGCAHIVQRSYLQLAFKEPEHKEKYLEKCLKLCLRLLNGPTDPNPVRPLQRFESLASIYHERNMYKESFVFTEKWFELLNLMERHPLFLLLYKSSIKEATSFRNLFNMRHYDVRNRQKLMDEYELLEYLEKELKSEEELTSRFLLRCYIAIQRIATGDIETGRRELLTLPMEITSSISAPEFQFAVWVLQTIKEEQGKHWWNYDYSITVIEEYELRKNDAHVSDSYYRMTYAEKRKLNFGYEVVCKWREDCDLPLDNKKLNILRDFQKYSPAYLEDFYRSIGAGEYIQRIRQSLELHQSAMADPTLFLNQHLARFFAGQSPTSAGVPRARIFTYTSETLKLMHENAKLSFHQRDYKEAAIILWKIINVSKDLSMKHDSCRLLLHIVGVCLSQA